MSTRRGKYLTKPDAVDEATNVEAKKPSARGRKPKISPVDEVENEQQSSVDTVNQPEQVQSVKNEQNVKLNDDLEPELKKSASRVRKPKKMPIEEVKTINEPIVDEKLTPAAEANSDSTNPVVKKRARRVRNSPEEVIDEKTDVKSAAEPGGQQPEIDEEMAQCEPKKRIRKAKNLQQGEAANKRKNESEVEEQDERVHVKSNVESTGESQPEFGEDLSPCEPKKRVRKPKYVHQEEMPNKLEDETDADEQIEQVNETELEIDEDMTPCEPKKRVRKPKNFHQEETLNQLKDEPDTEEQVKQVSEAQMTEQIEPEMKKPTQRGRKPKVLQEEKVSSKAETVAVINEIESAEVQDELKPSDVEDIVVPRSNPRGRRQKVDTLDVPVDQEVKKATQRGRPRVVDSKAEKIDEIHSEEQKKPSQRGRKARSPLTAKVPIKNESEMIDAKEDDLAGEDPETTEIVDAEEKKPASRGRKPRSPAMPKNSVALDSQAEVEKDSKDTDEPKTVESKKPRGRKPKSPPAAEAFLGVEPEVTVPDVKTDIETKEELKARQTVESVVKKSTQRGRKPKKPIVSKGEYNEESESDAPEDAEMGVETNDEPQIDSDAIKPVTKKLAPRGRKAKTQTLPKTESQTEMALDVKIDTEKTTESIVDEMSAEVAVKKSGRGRKPKSPAVKNARAKQQNVNGGDNGEQEPPAIEDLVPWEPQNWRVIYENIKKMRDSNQAPIDSMGCDKCHDVNVPAKVQRLQMLISLMLSSQTRDEITHAVMLHLREKGLSVDYLLNISESELASNLRPVSFQNVKAKHIKKCAAILREKYNDDIPTEFDEMCELPGVGPKMANLLMQCAWNKLSGIAVDTHVHRIANRLGWTRKPTKDADATQAALEAWLPKQSWVEINHLLVGFGQTICSAVKPKCADCLNRDICPSSEVKYGSPPKKQRAK